MYQNPLTENIFDQNMYFHTENQTTPERTSKNTPLRNIIGNKNILAESQQSLVQTLGSN